MIAYLTGLYGALHALLPLLLVIAVLTLLGFILDSKRGEW